METTKDKLKARIGKAIACRQYLHFNGYTSNSEDEMIDIRISKAQARHGIDIAFSDIKKFSV